MNFKRTKLIALMLLLCTLTLIFSSCTRDKIDKPEDTNLEYWLLDRPDKKNWTLISSDCYLAAGYEAVLDENGEICAPEYAVIYYIDHYPISEIGFKRIDGIAITDPNVYVWGLTINSTKEEVVEVLSELGFSLDIADNVCSAEMGQYKIRITYGESLLISYRKFSIVNTIIFGEKSYN